MERVLKWLLPLLILAQGLLVVGSLVPADTALMVGGVVELLLLVVVLRQLLIAVKRYRADRTRGLSVERAIEDGVAVFLPKKIARLVALEPRIWLYLYRWLFRRRTAAPNEFSYKGRSIMGTLMAVVFISGPVELLLVELLVPWPAVRWAVFILGLYGAIWVAGLYASIRVRPHTLGSTGLRIYYGVLAEGFIPYGNIAGVKQERRNVSARMEGLLPAPKEGATYLPVGGRTDVTLSLNHPVAVEGLLAAVPGATTIYLAADEPGLFADALNERRARSEASAA